MKLYFHGHDYKYAAEQMLLSPHGICHPVGAPDDFICSGEMNSPGIKVLLRKTLGTRHSARKGQQRQSRRYL